MRGVMSVESTYGNLLGLYVIVNVQSIELAQMNKCPVHQGGIIVNVNG